MPARGDCLRPFPTVSLVAVLASFSVNSVLLSSTFTPLRPVDQGAHGSPEGPVRSIYQTFATLFEFILYCPDLFWKYPRA